MRNAISLFCILSGCGISGHIDPITVNPITVNVEFPDLMRYCNDQCQFSADPNCAGTCYINFLNKFGTGVHN